MVYGRPQEFATSINTDTGGEFYPEYFQQLRANGPAYSNLGRGQSATGTVN